MGGSSGSHSEETSEISHPALRGIPTHILCFWVWFLSEQLSHFAGGYNPHSDWKQKMEGELSLLCRQIYEGFLDRERKKEKYVRCNMITMAALMS